MKILKIYLCLLLILLSGCVFKTDNDLTIDRYPPDVGEYFRNARAKQSLEQILTPNHDVYDFRSTDLTQVDLSQNTHLSHSQFDSETIWPQVLPNNFSPDKVMENGKDVGLNVAKLHKQGITGEGINVAIIDSALLVDHDEYAQNIKMYKEFHIDKRYPIDMHGTMVTSVLAGQTVGVAPDVGIYYIADTNIGSDKKADYRNYAKDIDYIINLNKHLSANQKIKIISISAGMTKETIGYKEFHEAVSNARKSGIEVFWVSSEDEAMHPYIGTGKIESGDYNHIQNIEPAHYLKDSILTNHIEIYGESLLIPVDQKTYASFTGKNSYVYNYSGGMSTVIPYVAGLYALALQLNPSISFNQFTNYAQQVSVPVYDKNQGILFGRYFDAEVLMNHIRNK